MADINKFEPLVLEEQAASALQVLNVYMINQDPAIVVFDWRLSLDGQVGPWSSFATPVGVTCTADDLRECQVNGKFVYVTQVDVNIRDKKLQVRYRKSGGPLKGAQAELVRGQPDGYWTFIPRGALS